MRTNHTGIILLVDRSGSMFGTESDTIGSINRFIKEQKENVGTAEFALVQFNSNIDELNLKDINEVEELNSKSYIPSGTTALNDAIGITVTKYGSILNERKEEDRPENIIFCLITDGLENASKEYNQTQIKDMINHQKEKYNWKFLFFGANIDSFYESNIRGIQSNLTTNWTVDPVGIKSTYATISHVTSHLRSLKSDLQDINVKNIYNQMNENIINENNVNEVQS